MIDKRQKYEYKVIQFRGHLTETELDSYGIKGWRLVTVHGNHDYPIYTFIREKE